MTFFEHLLLYTNSVAYGHWASTTSATALGVHSPALYICIYMYFLTSGSECNTDGVNDGSRSSRDGEEAACQSEDDKALWFKMKIHVYMFF